MGLMLSLLVITLVISGIKVYYFRYCEATWWSGSAGAGTRCRIILTNMTPADVGEVRTTLIWRYYTQHLAITLCDVWSMLRVMDNVFLGLSNNFTSRHCASEKITDCFLWLPAVEVTPLLMMRYCYNGNISIIYTDQRRKILANTSAKHKFATSRSISFKDSLFSLKYTINEWEMWHIYIWLFQVTDPQSGLQKPCGAKDNAVQCRTKSPTTGIDLELLTAT